MKRLLFASLSLAVGLAVSGAHAADKKILAFVTNGSSDFWKAAAAGHVSRDVPPAELDRVRVAFYRHVGDLLGCDIVRSWLETVETGRPASVHPLAYC